MNPPIALLCLLMVLVPVYAAAQGPLTDAQRAEWKDLRPDMPGQAVKRTTDRYPLSDQKNVGRWAKFEPMTDEFKGRTLDAAKWWPTNPTWKGRQPGWFD